MAVQWWRRREVWLGVLSVVLMGVLYNQLSAWLVPSLPPDLLSAGGGAPGRGAAPPADAVPEVRIDALGSQRSPYDPLGRNLFQYGHRQPPPPPPPTPAEVAQEEARRRQEEEEQRRKVEEILKQRREEEAMKAAAQQQPPPQAPEAPSAAPSVPLPPAPDYKFVGYMGKAADKIAVLLHEGEVVLIKEGEKLGKDFVVREIRFETVELGYTDPRFKDHKQMIPMGN